MPAPRRQPRHAVVETVERLTPRMLRIVFGGDGLAGFGAGEFTDHYVKLQLPDGDRTRVRTYTVREWDGERLTIDFVVHGDVGVAGPWALAARPGDTLELLGPGGAYAPSPHAGWHLMAGDPSVLPAIAASLARVPAGRRVDVLVQVEDADDEIELSSTGDLRVQWIHERGDGVLADAIRALEWPDDSDVHAFVHGEASSVREVRRLLLGERALSREAVSISGYWKRTRTEEGWREDKPEWNRLVEADLTAA